MVDLERPEETSRDRAGVTTLKDRLIAMIRADGPMPVSAYMNTCLHDPKQGYYATRPGLGRDFITAPEISQVFGELLGLWAAHEWQVMGTPDPVNLVELGPGRGTLMADALRAGAALPGFLAAKQLHLVEASPALRTAQAKTLGRHAPQFCNELGDVPPGPALVLGNEYLDCLPARQFVQAGGNWHERVIGLGEDGELSFGLAADRAPDGLATGASVSAEIQPSLELFVDQFQQRLEQGAPFRALLIDYGPADGVPGDSLRAYKAGEQVHPLAAPGDSDLTVDVDFSRLKRVSEAAGLNVHGPVPQGQFLLALGAEARLNALAKAQPDAADALYHAVRRLVDPAEMGTRFNVICLSSPGLPEPAGF